MEQPSNVLRVRRNVKDGTAIKCIMSKKMCHRWISHPQCTMGKMFHRWAVPPAWVGYAVDESVTNNHHLTEWLYEMHTNTNDFVRLGTFYGFPATKRLNSKQTNKNKQRTIKAACWSIYCSTFCSEGYYTPKSLNVYHSDKHFRLLWHSLSTNLIALIYNTHKKICASCLICWVDKLYGVRLRIHKL